jgi:hypothetical protein
VIIAIWVVSIVLVGAAAALGGIYWPFRRPAPAEHVDRLVRERVMVTMKSKAAFDGVLWESSPRGLVLVQATAMTETGAIPVDGELFLFVGDVAYIQKP